MTQLHVVALSGGKDSTAMALRLRELNPDVDYQFVITPTGNELPEMFAHWRHLETLLGKRLNTMMQKTLFACIKDNNMIPNFRARFCTRQLKIEPYLAWLLGHANDENVTGITSYVGIRADEPERVAGDYSRVPGIVSAFPLREWGWGLTEVVDYLAERDVEIPKRTDCALCFWQRLEEWHDLWREYPDLYAEGEAIEAEYGYTFRSPQRDSWPAGLAELRQRFEAGDVPRKFKQKRDPYDGAKCRVCRL